MPSTYERLDKNGLSYVLSKLKSELDEKAVIVSLTQAEYNALTAEEKNKPNTIYEITDAGSSSSGGHTILNASNVPVHSRTNLQFQGATVTDDETNDKTVISFPNFITNTVNNLAHYYLKTEVDTLINTAKNGRYILVNTLPTEDIDTKAIYLVPKSTSSTNNIKDEYINLDGTSTGWEKIGDTEIDLSGYATTSAMNTALAGKMNKVNGTEGQIISFDSNGNPVATDPSGSGHTIVSESGTAVTSRSNLKFINMTITDDASSDTTIIRGLDIIPLPNIINNVYYTGNIIYCCENLDYYRAVSNITGTASSVSVGSFSVTFSLKDTINTKWSDGTTTPKLYNWNILAAVYGAEWDGTSTTKWTRTDLAANFSDPIPAINNGTGSSPFDNISPWKDMVRKYRAGGVMVSIPKFYYKWTRTGTKMKLQISISKEEGFLTSPAHADRGDGKGERDIVYVGAYHCSTDDYKSTSGVKPKATVTRENFRTSIHNLGANIWQYDYAMYWTICMLYLVEFADWNSQVVIGYGCGSDSSAENSGLCDAMKYHTGTNAENRTTYSHIRYRYIEDLWSNVMDLCDGIYFSKNDVYVIKNPANFSDITGGTKVGTMATSSNYISAWTTSTVNGLEYAIYPSAVSVTDSTYISDWFNYGSSGVAMYVGGSFWLKQQKSGLFCIFNDIGKTQSSSSIGSRVMELPDPE